MTYVYPKFCTELVCPELSEQERAAVIARFQEKRIAGQSGIASTPYRNPDLPTSFFIYEPDVRDAVIELHLMKINAYVHPSWRSTRLMDDPVLVLDSYDGRHFAMIEISEALSISILKKQKDGRRQIVSTHGAADSTTTLAEQQYRARVLLQQTVEKAQPTS